MRGKGIHGITSFSAFRITPAYAGKRRARFQFQFDFQDHPRLCGEKVTILLTIIFCAGSPPPMRGKDERGNTEVCGWGITPAYAGKRTARNALRSCTRDHPRLCGEKYRTANHFQTNKGSPPPMRGKVASSAASVSSTRITPAYAGKSEYFLQCNSFRWDHPRLCGEKCAILCRDIRREGITPAYAGKSRCYSQQGKMG